MINSFCQSEKLWNEEEDHGTWVVGGGGGVIKVRDIEGWGQREKHKLKGREGTDMGGVGLIKRDRKSEKKRVGWKEKERSTQTRTAEKTSSLSDCINYIFW